jgi:integrase
MSVYKRGKVYWYKFMWQGELIRESTKQGNDREARNMEAAHRTRLSKAKDEREEAQRQLKCTHVLRCEECEKWFDKACAQQQDSHDFCSGSCVTDWTKRHRRIPTLAEFLTHDFATFAKAHFSSTPKTADYYTYGTALLLDAGMGELLLNEINSKHAAGFIARKKRLSPSTINCGLRTLRRSLNLAEEWCKIDRAPKIPLAKGEHQRDRFVTVAEFLAYRELCDEPWGAVATVLYGTGMRPGEIYGLRWEHVLLNGSGGLIQIAKGKSKAAKRFLPMVPEVYSVLTARYEEQEKPSTGWVFPAESDSGHFEQDSAKHCHGRAMATLTAASAAYEAWVNHGSKGDWAAVVGRAAKLDETYLHTHRKVIHAGWKRFPPYCLRHTALTNLGQSGCDAFTLARIAGHSSITITQRYIHPQADAIERAFERLAGKHNESTLRAVGGHSIGHTRILPQKNKSGK